MLIWTDGSADSEGFGGWAAILFDGRRRKEVYAGAAVTTNNRMEMTAVLEGLRALRLAPLDVVVFSDSAYVVNCFKDGWIPKWRKRGWRNSRSRPVENRDLWEALEVEVARHRVSFEHIRGHRGERYNERADELAGAARLAARGG